ncbi:MAG: hypothetical protein ACRC0G_07885 [Fusobacteriaceae bacterium]
MLPYNGNTEYTSESVNRLMILDNVGDEMITDMIRAQLDDPFNHLILEDYLEILDDKREDLLTRYSENSEQMDEFNNYENNIYLMIAEATRNRYNIEIISDSSDVAYKLIVKNMYRVLYLDYKNTIVTLFTSFIFKNRKGEIQEWIESKKDISSSSAKKTFKDIREALIMSNLPVIIERICTQYVDNDQVMNYLDWQSSSLGIDSFIQNYTENSIVIDEFFTSLITPYIESNEYTEGLVSSLVRSEVQMNLYSNFATTDTVSIVGIYDPDAIDENFTMGFDYLNDDDIID